MSHEPLQDFALAFLSILFEGAPFILLGTLISGFIDVHLPAGTMDRFLPRNRFLAVMMAGLLGAVFPVCECAVVPVIRRLVKKGLPVSCALTYMLAAPIVNPITALSTWKAFEGQGAALMTASRLGLGFVIAVAVGLLVLRLPLASVLKSGLVERPAEPPLQEHDHDHDCSGHGGCCHHAPPPTSEEGAKLVAAFRSAMKDFVDVGVYFTLGITITALFNTGIIPGAASLDSLAEHPTAAPAALMALAFVLSLCSTSDAFIAATLAKFSWGAKLAFLTFGPMMDVKLLFLYQTVMRKRFILWLAIGLFLSIGAASILFQQLVLTAMNPRTLRILHSLAVLVWSAVLLYFYASGRINKYLAPDFRPLVLGGGLGLAVLGGFNLLTAGREEGNCGHDHDESDGPHHHENNDIHPLVVLIMMVAPVLLSVAWTKDSYSTSALTRKGLFDAPQGLATSMPATLRPESIDLGQRKTADGHLRFNLMELFFATGVRELQSQIDGQKVETEGRWMDGRDKSQKDSRTRLYRMFITCCAADSRAIPILLEFEGTPPEFHSNAWVRVSGTMRYRLEDGLLQPIMLVDRATETALPSEENLMRK